MLLAGPAPVRKLEQERRVADTQYTLHTAESDESQGHGGPCLAAVSFRVHQAMSLVCGRSFPFMSSHHFIKVKL